MDKLLSICIPTYNRAQFLILALDSIIPQISSEIEIIISNNGSTDQTLICLKSYEEKFSYIRIYSFETNQGIDKNIENCFLKAQGEYVFLFSDDDILLPGSLVEIIQCLKDKEPSTICLNHFTFKNHSLVHRLPPVLSNKNICFEKGKPFFKYCGLGFLSSLIVDRYEALKYLPTIKRGRECAHLDVVGRVALTGHGPFIFLGKIQVAARSIDPPRYSALHSCILHQKAFYEDLLDEGLLDISSFDFFIKRLIYKDLPRILLRTFRAKGSLDIKDYESLLKNGFEEYISFKLFIKPLFSMNKTILNIFYKVAFATLKTYRKLIIHFSS